MKAVIQRVSNASVSINAELHSSIQSGLLVLLGIEGEDTLDDGNWLCKKILNMRIFHDQDYKMNLSLLDIKGEILVVSQFTLHASTKQGNRPSFIKAAKPEWANELYENFVEALTKTIDSVQTGVFGADMQVSLTNDGPVTIIIDSKDKQ